MINSAKADEGSLSPETDPSPVSHLTMRATLSHKGRGQEDSHRFARRANLSRLGVIDFIPKSPASFRTSRLDQRGVAHVINAVRDAVDAAVSQDGRR
jgi:hypothetical protein